MVQISSFSTLDREFHNCFVSKLPAKISKLAFKGNFVGHLF